MPSSTTQRLAVLCFLIVVTVVVFRFSLTDSGTSAEVDRPVSRVLDAGTFDSKAVVSVRPAVSVASSGLDPLEEDESASVFETLPEDEQASLWKAFAEARHAVEALDEREAAMDHNQGVVFFANNPGNGFAARFFATGGVRLGPGNVKGDWNAELYHAEGGVPRIVGNSRVEIDYPDGNIEWYENKPEGLEHGFVLHNDTRSDRDGSLLEIGFRLDHLSAEADPANLADLIFVNENGDAVLGYQNLKVWDASGVTLSAHMSPTDHGVLIAIDDRDARYPITVDPWIIGLEQKLGPEVTGDGDPSDDFGYSVALDGNTALIGAYKDDTTGGTEAGSAYVFTRSGAVWTQEAKLEAGDAAFVDQFGNSVALHGNTALIGAYSDDTLAGSDAGSAYVFTRSGVVWTQEAKLEAGDAAAGYRFGSSVALDGNTAIACASGSAYVFTRSGVVWTQGAKLEASDPFAGFGSSVALDGNTALIGAYKDDTTGGTEAGSAYVFTRSGAVWTQEAKLEAGDAATGDRLGSSVALDGNTAVVAALMDDTLAGSDAGSAYVFTRSGVVWTQEAKLEAGDAAAGDQFGSSVALDGNTAVVGALYSDTAGGSNAGSAYVFTRSGAVWTQEAKLEAGDAADWAWFGRSVALDGNRAIVGAQRNYGGAYVFTRSGVVWTQEAKLEAGQSAEEDYFGHSIALDGDTALVGVPYDSTASVYRAGSAYVFTRNNGQWTEEGKLMSGAAPILGPGYSYFGSSVALDGNTALVGAPGDDDLYVGSVYIFTRSGAVWTQEAKLDGADWAWFGRSVALDGNTALVGASNDFTAGVRTGSAYVFTRSGVVWTQEAKLEAGDAAVGDWFGSSVALDGNTALIGAYWDDTAGGSDAGSAYVFTRSGVVWTQEAKLEAGDAAAEDEFGRVALDGNTALIGATGDDTLAGVDAGSAYVFTRSGAVWTQEAKLEAGDAAAGDTFGAVALDGNTAVVSAWGDDTTAGVDAGSAYVFTRSGVVWTQEVKLEAADAAPWDGYGASVALDGDTILISVPYENGYRLSGRIAEYQGSIYVFRINNDTDSDGLPDAWEQVIVDAAAGDSITTVSDVLLSDDFNSDGVSNLLAYALGLSPVDLIDFALLPKSGIRNGELEIIFSTLDWPPGEVNYIVEYSTDLAVWTEIARRDFGGFWGASGSATYFVDYDDGRHDVSVRTGVNFTTEPNQYLRLKVELP